MVKVLVPPYAHKLQVHVVPCCADFLNRGSFMHLSLRSEAIAPAIMSNLVNNKPDALGACITSIASAVWWRTSGELPSLEIYLCEMHSALAASIMLFPTEDGLSDALPPTVRLFGE